MLEERKEPKFDFEGVPEQPHQEFLSGDAPKIIVKEDKADNTPAFAVDSKDNDVSKLNKAVEKVKEGDVPAIASQKVVYGAARNAVLAKQAEEMPLQTENSLSKDDKKNVIENAISAKELAMRRQAQRDPSPENLAAYEMVYDSWKESRDRAHKLEAEYNDKYQKHIESQSALLRGVRRTFGLQPKLSGELKALQNASTTARREYHSAAKSLLNVRKGSISPRIKTSAITQSSKEYGGPEAVDKRYQSMLAQHLITGVHKKRLELQGTTIDKVWDESNVGRSLAVLQRNKYKTMSGIALGATVLSGGAFPVVIAGMAAGLGVGIGTYKILDKTWIASGRKKLINATSNLGSDFFEKSFLDEDGKMDYLTNDVETRTNLSKTASKIAGASAGMTTAGFVGGLGAESTIPDVTNTPTDAVSQTESLQQMGDASVAEKMYPDVKESFNQDAVTAPSETTPDPTNHAEMKPHASGGEEAIPRDSGGESLSEEHIGPDHEPHENYEHEEDVFAEPAVTHTVERGDNAWNIMEGKGPDNNPVGGKSEIVTDMSLADRRYWLDKLFDYCDQNPEFAKEVGAVKSGGNIHLIHPGETINVSMLDEKLVELMNQESSGSSESLITAPEVSETPSGPAPTTEQFSESGPVSLDSTPQMESYSQVKDFNNLTIMEVEKIASDISQNNPQVDARLEELGIDKNDFRDMYQSLAGRGGELDPNMTVSDWLQNSDKMTDDLPPTANDNSVPEATPFSGELPQPGDMPVRDANFIPEAAANNSEAVQSYVSSVENPKVGLFDRLFLNTNPNITGTWEALNPDQMTVGQFKEMVSSPNLEEELANRNLSAEGVTKWGETLQKQNQMVSANDNETLTQYLSRVTSGQRVA
ncbi:hypothetical protein H6788_01225 [Candidatus Nomurabacteria bacterium]|nr:hypothetical protein [Candidatus Nomurabacteria bacterium]